MTAISIRARRRRGEEGYTLVVVMIMTAVLVISLSVAAPKIKTEIQRDRELETLHRGQQYARAIKLFYRKFGAYPTSVDALENTNEIKFLRQRYTDPETGEDDWIPIPVGQNKSPLAMGFFGQPLGGQAVLPNGTVNSGGTSMVAKATLPGQSAYAGPIMGFSPASDQPSILAYKTKTHYNEWEFVYSPLADHGIIYTPVNQPPLQGGAPGVPLPAPSQPPGR